ncbi:MliC family protein [Edwardsiella hoshinae]|uniref:Membrane-bound lysozyme inhibitor of C-type lysozyme n=1 Tax=Edwardsiella hoshinae TaxID=93378 RepID=A0A376DGL2_9GAMM|nr:MliC family protein [Edwardsiella hoshinae]QPR27226.1 MliC family protein [Edwardsiella hoshinae]STC88082.1 Membrane-bound lysozyme inhibitor of C-type lysozyme precursor [Edwardsiella hoshinae]
MRNLMLAGAALLLAGCQLFAQGGQTLHYRCGTLPLTVLQDNKLRLVRMVLDGSALTLRQTLSASGVRYSDGRYTFWSTGNEAIIERDGHVIVNDCLLQPAATLSL